VLGNNPYGSDFEHQKGNSHTYLFVIIAIVLVVLIGVGLLFFFKIGVYSDKDSSSVDGITLPPQEEGDTNNGNVLSKKSKAESFEDFLSSSVVSKMLSSGFYELVEGIPFEVGGEIAYLVLRGDKKFVVFRGEEGKHYDRVFDNEVVDVGGLPTYAVSEGGSKFIVHGDREIGVEENYHQISHVVEVNGELAYIVRSQQGESLVVLDGNVLDKRYKNGITNVVDFGGRIAYVGYGMLGEYDEVIVDDEVVARYPKIVSSLYNIGGKLAFVAQEAEDMGGKQFVVFDGKEGKKYGEILYRFSLDINRKTIWIMEDEGRPAYVTRNDDAVVIGDREIDEYERIIQVGNKVAMYSKYSIVFDGEEIGSGYDSISIPPVNIDNKLAFIANVNDSSFIVYDDNVYGEKYGMVSSLTDVNGKLAYFVYLDVGESSFPLLVYDGKEISLPYAPEGYMVGIAGKIFYSALNEKGESVFVLIDPEVVE